MEARQRAMRAWLNKLVATFRDADFQEALRLHRRGQHGYRDLPPVHLEPSDCPEADRPEPDY